MRQFDETDYPELKAWYQGHGLSAPELEILPSYGLFVEKTAAGFVYLVEGKLALLEGFITNPLATKDERDQALNQIISGLEEYSRFCEVRRIMAASSLTAIQDRAKMRGYLLKTTMFLSKELL